MRLCLGQLKVMTPEIATYIKQLGIKSVQFNTPHLPAVDGEWRLEDIKALKAQCDEQGFIMESIENVPIEFYDKVMLGLPGRDEQIEKYQRLIRNMGEAGIPSLGYHFVPTFVWRTSRDTPGRGGVKVTSFHKSEEANGNTVDYFARTDIKIEDEEVMWANYKYFMDAILPVAEEAGVKLALHPDDPPVPMVAGVHRLFISLDAFKRAEQIAGDNKMWGLDLCLGTVSEMGGRDAVNAFIDYFGPKDRIHYVHFRDVQGSVPDFQECFLGEGNFNPMETLVRLKKSGFDGYIMDDHVPQFSSDIINPDIGWGYVSHGYENGYIEGLLTALDYFCGE